MLLIRSGIGLLMLLCAVEVFRMMRALNNRELIVITRRVALSILAFAALRVVGGSIDSYFEFQFPYLSTLSTYGFWIATYAFFWHHRRILQDVGHEGRVKISRNVDEIALEMKRFNKKLGKALEQ